MGPKSNEEVMKGFVEFINTANPELAATLIAPTATFHMPGRPEPMSGPDGYLAIIGMMQGGFPDIQWTVEEMVSERDKVAVRFTMRGTHGGTFVGVPPTAKKIAVQSMAFYRLANGQIVEEYGQPDMLGLLQQIGAAPRA
ncbi:MAG: ester cyclase [Deltaproteobacteria bacterium]